MSSRGARPSLAVASLGVILLVSAAWWTLALWPTTAATPDWILRTREVCFGSTASGLPHAGGWLLLIGEPIGLLAILMIVWGTELRTGLRRLHATFSGKLVSASVVMGLVVGLVAAGQRVAEARSGAPQPFAVNGDLPARRADGAPALRLVDQTGAVTDLSAYRGQWVLLTFAFGHCDDICPVIVQRTLESRRKAGATTVPLLVVTLDPWRDTPERLPTIATSWGIGGNDRVLSGVVDDVNVTLDAWNIARQRDSTTGDIAHGSVVVVLDPDGAIAWRLDGLNNRLFEALQLVQSAQQSR